MSKKLKVQSSKLKVLDLIVVALLLLVTCYLLPVTIRAQDYPKQSVLDVNLHYKDETVTLTSINRREGYLPDYLNQPTEGYTLVILDKDAQKLFKVKFNFPLEVITEDIAQGTSSIQTLTEADTTVIAPSVDSAQKLEILDPAGAKILDHNLSIITDPKLAERGATKPQANYLWLVGLIAISLLTAFAAFKIKQRKLNPNQPT